MKNVVVKGVKVWKSGNSFVLCIPADYIKNWLIRPNRRYDVQLQESKQKR